MTMTDEELIALRAKEAAGEKLAEAELARVTADKVGLQAQVGRLLSILDAWDTERANEFNGGLTMHTYGQTPDWFVEAAFWHCYGFGPADDRAALKPLGGEE